MSTKTVVLSLAVAVLGAAAVHAQAPAGGPPLPKPGPEHAVFKLDEGTWDAAVEMFPAPGAPAMTSKGVETNSVGCGGLCLVSDFKGDFGGMPFHGHGTSAYDPGKKKYVGSWTDSMSQGLMIGESTYDAATRTVTGYMEGPDMTGAVVKSKSVVEYKADGTRVMTMYTKGPDGKEAPNMRITYKKK